MSDYQGWLTLLHLPEDLEGPIVFIISMVFFLVFVFLPFTLVLGFVERKMVADLQARVGPNRAGPSGLFQSLADLLKLFVKAREGREDPSFVWSVLQNAAIYSIFAALPLGSSFIFLNSELNVLVPFLALTVCFLAQAMMGLADRRLDSILISFRSTFHFFSGVIPSILCVFTVGLLTGSLNWVQIGQAQNGGPAAWVAFSNPVGALSFLSFVLSGFLMFQLPPFHETNEGVRKIWGRRLALFQLNRSFLTMTWAIFAVVLYFGAWDFFGDTPEGLIGSLLEIFTVLIKAFIVVLLTRVISRAFPQIRMDQMTDFSWKVLTPLSLLCLLGAALWMGGGTP